MDTFPPDIRPDHDEEHYMKLALREASRALENDEVPIGAVIVMNHKIIARGYNQVEALRDSTAHAEIIALTSAFSFLGSKYLPDAAIYVTIEPCTMCCGALYWSKIGKLVYGAADPKQGGISLHNSSKKLLHPKTQIVKDVLAEECASLVQDFFRKKR
jgi:tRNA(adenine34) deaminase